jgi:hypothetical protein
MGHQHIYYKEGNTKVARAALCIHRIHHICFIWVFYTTFTHSKFLLFCHYLVSNPNSGNHVSLWLLDLISGLCCLQLNSINLLQFNCWNLSARISFFSQFLWEASLVLFKFKGVYALGWDWTSMECISGIDFGLACMDGIEEMMIKIIHPSLCTHTYGTIAFLTSLID